jgi:hypothetical protein
MAKDATRTPASVWCAHGTWKATIGEEPAVQRAAVIAVAKDGMLLAGDLPIRAGKVVSVTIHTPEGPHTVLAEVRRAPGSAFLRFTATATNRRALTRLLHAVGWPTTAL